MSSDLVRTNQGSDLVAIAGQTRQIKELGQTLLESGLLPDAIKKPEAAVAVMLKGQEIGMAPMYALSHIAIISGKPTMSAEAMLALVQRSGHRIRIKESTPESCTVEGVRANDADYPTTITWTMEDAKVAQLAGKGPWKTYPRAMLRARAISELCRAAFADVLSGVSYVPEELGAVVDEDGGVVDLSEDDSSGVEEAEVVEDEGPSHEEVVEWVESRLDEAPDGYYGGDPVAMVTYARSDLRKAMKTQQKMLRIIEDGGVVESEAS